MIYSGRYDARQDLGSLLGRAPRAGRCGPAGGPRDRRAVAAAAAVRRRFAGRSGGAGPGRRPRGRGRCRSSTRRGWTTPGWRRSSVARRSALLPVVSDSAGLPAIEAIACGVPVVASSVGALPEIVGAAGILVEPRDARRLASALETAFVDERVHATARRGGPGPGDERGPDVGRRRPGDARGLRDRDRAPRGERPRLTRPSGRRRPSHVGQPESACWPASGCGGGGGAPGVIVTLLPVRRTWTNVWPIGEGHRVAVLVEEPGRLGQAVLAPRALDRRPVRRDPGRARSRRRRPRGGSCASRRSAARTASA